MSYSQNKEDIIFSDYFKSFKGHLLEIGANDGQTLSNSLYLIRLGWAATLVEPDLTSLEKLNVLHRANSNVKIAPYAIGNVTGEIPFYESSSLLSAADHSLVSTTIESEQNRWNGINIHFKKTWVDCLTWSDFYKKYPAKYDLISLDAEGAEKFILPQMDLKEIGCKMICVEWNGKDFDFYNDIITKFGMRLIHTNLENLIYAI